MKAAVFHKPKDIRYETVADPKIEHPRDAILRVTSTTICGSDLHIYNGLFPQMNNMVLGHEFMGIIEEVGAEVKNLRRGDRVVVPFPISCGTCFFCNHKLPTACEHSNPKHYGPGGGVLSEKGGGLFGYTDLYGGYQGGQAEMVRIPFADYGPRKVSEMLTDEQVLFLSDIIPTGWSAVNWAQLKGGETVAVFGSGPVGLMAQRAALVQGAGRVIAIDLEQYRLNVSKEKIGAETINCLDVDPVAALRELTQGRGPDVCIDAVGMEANRSALEKISAALHFQRGTMKVISDAISSVRRGGVVSIVGVYGTSYDNFPVGQIFDKGLRIHAGQANVHNDIDLLMKLVEDKKIYGNDIISHRMPLRDVSQAYQMFNDKKDNCVKVVLKP